MEPKIIFDDKELLVIDKPAGMVVNRAESVKGKTVQEWIEGYLKIRSTKHEIRNKPKIKNANVQNNFEFRDSNFEFSRRAGIVHRLDKETSGLLIVAKTPEAFGDLQRQFKERKVKKTYLALVHGAVKPEEGEIRVPVGRLPWNRKRFGVLPGGREAITRYKVTNFYTLNAIPLALQGASSAYTLLELYPQTGRTHQLRVHLKYFGHPIFGDPLYAGRKVSKMDRKILPRLFLHAAKISFLHPKGGKSVSFESPLPQELQTLLSSAT